MPQLRLRRRAYERSFSAYPACSDCVALVTLLLNRLDRHKDAAKKELNIPDALRTFAGLMHAWTEQASMTNLAARRWVREEMPGRKPMQRQPRSLRGLYVVIHGQKAILNEIFGILSDPPEHNNLLRVLEVYTPELTDQLVKAANTPTVDRYLAAQGRAR
jgi:hypothetical protein